MALWSPGGVPASEVCAQDNDGDPISCPTPQPAAWPGPAGGRQEAALAGHDGPAHLPAQDLMCHGFGLAMSMCLLLGQAAEPDKVFILQQVCCMHCWLVCHAGQPGSCAMEYEIYLSGC